MKVLGEGGFGKVYLGEHKQTKEKVAMKMIDTKGMGNVDDIDTIFSEAGTLKSLQHENIVKLHNYFLMKNSQAIFIMEFLEGGELLEFVEKKGRLSEDVAREIFVQIVSAINYCHNHRIIHRDLKLENILFSNTTELKVKVVDFGIAGLCAGANTEKTEAGSLRYLAPELLSGRSIDASPALDVWAIGCILYFMLMGVHPMDGKSFKEIKDKILFQEITFPPKTNLSLEVRHLIGEMLQKEKKARISLSDVQGHAWVKKTQLPVSVKQEEEKKKEEVLKKPSTSSSSTLASKPKVSNVLKIESVGTLDQNKPKKGTRTSIFAPTASSISHQTATSQTSALKTQPQKRFSTLGNLKNKCKGFTLTK